MDIESPLKEAYIVTHALRKHGINDTTMTHKLLQYKPDFLMLDENWVDALLEAELSEIDVSD